MVVDTTGKTVPLTQAQALAAAGIVSTVQASTVSAALEQQKATEEYRRKLLEEQAAQQAALSAQQEAYRASQEEASRIANEAADWERAKSLVFRNKGYAARGDTSTEGKETSLWSKVNYLQTHGYKSAEQKVAERQAAAQAKAVVSESLLKDIETRIEKGKEAQAALIEARLKGVPISGYVKQVLESQVKDWKTLEPARAKISYSVTFPKPEVTATATPTPLAPVVTSVSAPVKTEKPSFTDRLLTNVLLWSPARPFITAAGPTIEKITETQTPWIERYGAAGRAAGAEQMAFGKEVISKVALAPVALIAPSLFRVQEKTTGIFEKIPTIPAPSFMGYMPELKPEEKVTMADVKESWKPIIQGVKEAAREATVDMFRPVRPAVVVGEKIAEKIPTEKIIKEVKERLSFLEPKREPQGTWKDTGESWMKAGGIAAASFINPMFQVSSKVIPAAVGATTTVVQTTLEPVGKFIKSPIVREIMTGPYGAGRDVGMFTKTLREAEKAKEAKKLAEISKENVLTKVIDPNSKELKELSAETPAYDKAEKLYEDYTKASSEEEKNRIAERYNAFLENERDTLAREKKTIDRRNELIKTNETAYDYLKSSWGYELKETDKGYIIKDPEWFKKAEVAGKPRVTLLFDALTEKSTEAWMKGLEFGPRAVIPGALTKEEKEIVSKKVAAKAFSPKVELYGKIFKPVVEYGTYAVPIAGQIKFFGPTAEKALGGELKQYAKENPYEVALVYGVGAYKAAKAVQQVFPVKNVLVQTDLKTRKGLVVKAEGRKSYAYAYFEIPGKTKVRMTALERFFYNPKYQETTKEGVREISLVPKKFVKESKVLSYLIKPQTAEGLGKTRTYAFLLGQVKGKPSYKFLNPNLGKERGAKLFGLRATKIASREFGRVKGVSVDLGTIRIKSNAYLKLTPEVKSLLKKARVKVQLTKQGYLDLKKLDVDAAKKIREIGSLRPYLFTKRGGRFVKLSRPIQYYISAGTGATISSTGKVSKTVYGISGAALIKQTGKSGRGIYTGAVSAAPGKVGLESKILIAEVGEGKSIPIILEAPRNVIVPKLTKNIKNIPTAVFSGKKYLPETAAKITTEQAKKFEKIVKSLSKKEGISFTDALVKAKIPYDAQVALLKKVIKSQTASQKALQATQAAQVSSVLSQLIPAQRFAPVEKAAEKTGITLLGSAAKETITQLRPAPVVKTQTVVDILQPRVKTKEELKPLQITTLEVEAGLEGRTAGGLQTIVVPIVQPVIEPEVKEKEEEIQIQIPRVIPDIAERQIIGGRERLIRSIPSWVPVPEPKLVEKAPGTYPPILFGIPLPEGSLVKRKKKRRLPFGRSAYEIMIKRRVKGKKRVFKPLGVSLPKEKAEALAMQELLRGPEATAKLVPTTKKVSLKAAAAIRVTPSVKKYFRAGRRGEIIQKERARIITAGEKKAITRYGLTRRALRRGPYKRRRKSFRRIIR